MEKLELQLKGTTLRVYWHLLRSGKPTTLRRLQRSLGLSSPSVASYHLEKLRDLDLVKKDRGNYELNACMHLETVPLLLELFSSLTRFAPYACSLYIGNLYLLF